MSSKYKFRNQDALYFISFSVVQWVDVFTRRLYKDILIESLAFCQKNKGLRIHAYCIMTNHVHLIISRTGSQRMEHILRDLKKFTAHQLLKEIEGNSKESRRNWMLWIFRSAGMRKSSNEKYQFWIHGNHPIELYDNHIMDQKLDYIHQNPVEAGFVDEPEEYLYSSARNYAGRVGLLDIYLIE